MSMSQLPRSPQASSERNQVARLAQASYIAPLQPLTLPNCVSLDRPVEDDRSATGDMLCLARQVLRASNVAASQVQDVGAVEMPGVAWMISATASSSADVACMYVHVCITDEVTTELTYRLTGWLTYCTGCAMIMVHNMLCVRWCMGHCTSVYVLLCFFSFFLCCV